MERILMTHLSPGQPVWWRPNTSVSSICLNVLKSMTAEGGNSWRQGNGPFCCNNQRPEMRAMSAFSMYERKKSYSMYISSGLATSFFLFPWNIPAGRVAPGSISSRGSGSTSSTSGLARSLFTIPCIMSAGLAAPTSISSMGFGSSSSASGLARSFFPIPSIMPARLVAPGSISSMRSGSSSCKLELFQGMSRCSECKCSVLPHQRPATSYSTSM
mmetsp:Transcript_4331/g.16287  ORF Transcript_4331/g.16287 Transcript_4331/m.16287 type:complete len:215 (+) Transcript_4331:1721-2365(+)